MTMDYKVRCPSCMHRFIAVPENVQHNIKTLKDRVAELEAEVKEARKQGLEDGYMRANIENVGAYMSLKEAAEQVVFECEADDDAMMPSVAAVFKLRALLQGKGNELPVGG
jgi:hypothetical protein